MNWLEAVGYWLVDRWRLERDEWCAFVETLKERFEEARFRIECRGVRLADEAGLDWPFRWSTRYLKRWRNRVVAARLNSMDFGPVIRAIASFGVTCREAAESIRSFARYWRRLEDEMKRKGAGDGTP